MAYLTYADLTPEQQASIDRQVQQQAVRRQKRDIKRAAVLGDRMAQEAAWRRRVSALVDNRFAK